MALHALDGKTALVCGASRGIGRASAFELARRGANVVVSARRAALLDALVRDLPGDGEHRAVPVDLSDTEAAVEALAEACAGEATILVNNTGGPPPGKAAQASAEDFLAGLGPHLLVASQLTRALLPAMREGGFGRVINVISTSVKVPIPGLAVSNATRAAVASWAKTLSLEVAADGVTVNNVLPGFTDTDRLRALIATRATAQDRSEDEVADAMRATVPAGRFGTADEIAAVVGFLASPAAAYVNGVSIPVDGGRTGAL